MPPLTTAFGALLNHITGGHIVSDDEPGKRSFQPMNINFGLFPPVEAAKAEGKRLRGKDKTVAKRLAVTSRALVDCRIRLWREGPFAEAVASSMTEGPIGIWMGQPVTPEGKLTFEDGISDPGEFPTQLTFTSKGRPASCRAAKQQPMPAQDREPCHAIER